MEEKNIRVSAAMASYNGAFYIERQIESILVNLREEDELVISDDGSTDGTLQILERLKGRDARIRVIDGPGKGIKKNFENAISNCRGQYIFLTDQDDIWVENKVETVLEVFHKCGCSLVMHDAIVVNEDNTKELMPSFFAYRGSKAGAFANIVKNSYMGCCMAFKSDIMDWILPIPDEIQMHDQWIGVLNDIRKTGTCMIEDKLLFYRRHTANNSDFSHNTMPIMIRNRIVFLRALIRRMYRVARKKSFKNNRNI